MTTINPELENKLRQGFKYLNRFMLIMWRLGMGKWLPPEPKPNEGPVTVHGSGTRQPSRPLRVPE